MLGIQLFRSVLGKLNPRKNKVLLYAQTAMSEHQFVAFKKLFLDEFGERGFEGELKPLLMDRQPGMDGNGRE